MSEYLSDNDYQDNEPPLVDFHADPLPEKPTLRSHFKKFGSNLVKILLKLICCCRSESDDEMESLLEETDESPAPPEGIKTTETVEETEPLNSPSPVNYDTHSTEYDETESMETFPPTPPEGQNTRTVKTTETTESETSPPSPPDIQSETMETDSPISSSPSSSEMENTETEEDTPAESQREEEARPLAECRNGGHLGQFVNGVYILPEHRQQNQEKESHVAFRLGEEDRPVEKEVQEVNPLAPRAPPPPSPDPPSDDLPAQDDQDEEARPVVFEVGFETPEDADEWYAAYYPPPLQELPATPQRVFMYSLTEYLHNLGTHPFPYGHKYRQAAS